MRLVNKLCALSMVLSIAAILYAGLAGHFAPAPLPTDAAAKVGQFFQQYNHQILIFAFFGCLSTPLMIPAFCALSAAMMSMRPRNATLALLQLTAGTLATVGPFLSSMVLAAAVVRPDNPPEILATLTDLTVVLIELSTLPALFQGVCIAAAAFSDRSLAPVLPRWYGWVSLVWGIMAQGGLFAVFYETGPLSSTGFIGIVLPIASLFIWMAATAVVVYRIEPTHEEIGLPGFAA